MPTYACMEAQSYMSQVASLRSLATGRTPTFSTLYARYVPYATYVNRTITCSLHLSPMTMYVTPVLCEHNRTVLMCEYKVESERRSASKHSLRVATFCQISPLWPAGSPSKTSEPSLDLEKVAPQRVGSPGMHMEASFQ